MTGIPLTPLPAVDGRFQPLHWRVIVLCGLVALLDGFDTQAIGPAAKMIAGALSIPMKSFGLVFSASQVGFLIGALLFSALGDRLGRKKLLVAATLLFAVCSAGTAMAESFPALLAFRVLAGLGLGGASPNFISLASEYAPPRQRAKVVTTLWAAVPFGGMVAAFAGAAILPTLGWRSLFYIGAAAPVALAILLVFALPESQEIRKAPVSAGHRRSPIGELFADGLAPSTVWLWLASFMLWTALVATAVWTPTLLHRAGLTVGAASSMLALNNAGGVVGTVLVGATLARIRPARALAATLALGGLFVIAIGLCVTNLGLLSAVTAAAGFLTSAAGGAMLAVSAATYPDDARATGVGWALGFGRVGAVLGPTAIGLLVAADWPVARLYLVLGAPFVLASLFILLLIRQSALRPRSGGRPDLGDARCPNPLP